MGKSLLIKTFICELLGYEILGIGIFLWKRTHITAVLSLWISVIIQ